MNSNDHTTIDEWSGLADLLANLIAKYASELEHELDESCELTKSTVIQLPQGGRKQEASLHSYIDCMKAA